MANGDNPDFDINEAAKALNNAAKALDRAVKNMGDSDKGFLKNMEQIFGSFLGGVADQGDPFRLTGAELYDPTLVITRSME